MRADNSFAVPCVSVCVCTVWRYLALWRNVGVCSAECSLHRDRIASIASTHTLFALAACTRLLSSRCCDCHQPDQSLCQVIGPTQSWSSPHITPRVSSHRIRGTSPDAMALQLDPAESILSLLSNSFDPFAQDEALDMGLGDMLSNDYLFQSDDNLISDFLNDDLLSSLDFVDPAIESDLFQTHNSKNFTPRNRSKITLNSAKPKSPSQNVHKSFSILNSPSNKRNAKVTISMNSPKVYITPSTKKSSGAGTSILVKSKKSKQRSLLLQNKEPVKYSELFNSSVLIPELLDHDYCFSRLKDDIYTKKECPSFTTTNVDTEVKNEFDDIMQGFIPDDVMLNELPNCLQDLMNLDTSYMLNSDDVLHGLNDACNLLTDHYFEDLEQKLCGNIDGFNLPNLDITEDDLNVSSQNNSLASVDDCAAKDIEVDYVYSPMDQSLVDSFDCASVTTGCTEESSSEDTDCLSSSLNPKRHRSLSNSSVNRRKRRFSSRSSLNSSDAMSDTSSVDDSAPSSRSSSPERSLKMPFGSFSPKKVYQKTHSKFQLINKNRPRKHVSWSSKYSDKYDKSVLVKKKKMKVIDLTHRNYSLTSHKTFSRGETGASQVSEVNEKVLYIGDIPDGTKKSDINAWFGKFGNIEDIQMYFCDTGNNYAFVTYKYNHETRNAIKHGNDDLRHSKLTLSYGKRRNTSYKDLDLFNEGSLDFRIDSDSDAIDFDTLLRSTTVESHKLKKYL